jgi:hypothetical protein
MLHGGHARLLSGEHARMLTCPARDSPGGGKLSRQPGTEPSQEVEVSMRIAACRAGGGGAPAAMAGVIVARLPRSAHEGALPGQTACWHAAMPANWARRVANPVEQPVPSGQAEVIAAGRDRTCPHASVLACGHTKQPGDRRAGMPQAHQGAWSPSPFLSRRFARLGSQHDGAAPGRFLACPHTRRRAC